MKNCLRFVTVTAETKALEIITKLKNIKAFCRFSESIKLKN